MAAFDDEWVDHTHATSFEAYVASVEDILRGWKLAHQGTVPGATPTVQTKLLEYDSMKWHISLYNFMSVTDANSIARSISECNPSSPTSGGEKVPSYSPQWSNPKLKHLTPSMLSLLDAPPTLMSSDLSPHCHALRRYFGVQEFLTLTLPDSSHSMFLPPSLSRFLLNGVGIALGNVQCTLPVFVAVGTVPDYIGIAVPGGNGGPSIKFDSSKKLHRPPRFFSTLSTVTSMFLEKINAYASGSLRTSISVRHSWRFSISSLFERLMGSNSRKNEIDAKDNGKARSWWRSPGDWGPLDDPIETITVYVAWPRFAAGTFVDNETYTDLVASQAPEWFVRVQCKNNIDLPMASQLYFQSLAQNIHRDPVSSSAVMPASGEGPAADDDGENDSRAESAEDEELEEDDSDDDFQDACGTLEELEKRKSTKGMTHVETLRHADSVAIKNMEKLPSLALVFSQSPPNVKEMEKQLSIATALLAHFPAQFRLVNALLRSEGNYPVQIIGEAERRSIERSTSKLDGLAPHNREYILRSVVSPEPMVANHAPSSSATAYRMYCFSSNNEIRVATSFIEQ